MSVEFKEAGSAALAAAAVAAAAARVRPLVWECCPRAAVTAVPFCSPA